jgi:DNA-binding CsgD family transcriptional regulator/PAS domain-containing protein
MPKGVKSSEIPLETFSEVVETIYDCALDPSGWQRTLRRMIQLCQGISGVMGVHDLANRRNELTYSFGVHRDYQKLVSKYAPMNPYPVPQSLIRVGTVITSDDLVDRSELIESRFYQEFLKPQGIEDIAGFNVLKTSRRIGYFSINSPNRCGEPEFRLLTLLAPHICRSVTISDALNLKTVHADTLEATLNALTCGVFMTDREARVAYMNRAAEHEVKTGDALRVANNCLSAVDYAARAVLTRAIAEATVDETRPPSSGITVALPAGEDLGLIATVLPLNRGERLGLAGSFAATAAIFVQDPVVVPQLAGEAFAKLYGLTGSELRVLLAMAPGLSVKEAAEVLGISETTAKTHLQHIYAKTGTSKQTELMHLFMSSTPPIQAA